jgi:Ser/Thr protein kinase RdoA (MazF antagonist)
MITPMQVKNLLNQEYSITDYKLSDLGGHKDKIYRIQPNNKDYVLKISLNRKMTKHQFVSQVKYVEYLREHGYESPELIVNKNNQNFTHVSDYKIRYAVLMPFISELNDVSLSSDKENISFGNYIGKLHNASLTYKGDSYWYYGPIFEEERKLNDLAKHFSNTSLFEKLIKLKSDNIKKFKESTSKLRTSMLLNDLAPGNIYMKNDKIIFIDWNIAGKGYIAEELSWIIAWHYIKGNCIDKLPIFLKAYSEQIKLNRDELMLLTYLPINYAYLMWNNFDKVKKTSSNVQLSEKIGYVNDKLIEYIQ